MAKQKKFQNSLGDALGAFWTEYVGWGRATRSEYWWVVLFYYNLVPMFLFLTVILSPLYFIWFFATLVPSFTLMARRLHDAGHSNWNLCWLFLPIVGPIILLVYLCQPSEKKSNKWGAPRI